MFSEDRVLVGVIQRKRDLNYAIKDKWYRIPQKQMPRGINAEYVGFFLSGSVFKEQSGGIHYYAKVSGFELAYRKDLLPKEANHKRADEVYYRVALEEVLPKTPPVLNPTKRPIIFIRTTWDRFTQAREIKDLYSDSDYFVDRIYHALRNKGLEVYQYWETEQNDFDFAPGVSILCENNKTLEFSMREGQGAYFMDVAEPEDKLLRAIMEEVNKRGGPATITIPPE